MPSISSKLVACHHMLHQSCMPSITHACSQWAQLHILGIFIPYPTKGGFTHQARPKEMLSQLTVWVGQNQPSLSCHMAVTWSNSRGVFEHLGPKLQVGLHENFVPVALSWSQIFGTTLLPHGHYVGQVEVWAEPLYKVLWPNLQHLSSTIGQCRGFFGTGLVCKAPLSLVQQVLYCQCWGIACKVGLVQQAGIRRPILMDLSFFACLEATIGIGITQNVKANASP
jgi:hypothetical protein